MNVTKTLTVFGWLLLSLCIFSLNSLEAVWGPPVTISSPRSSIPQIGMDNVGNAIAIWQEFDGTDLYIQTAQLPVGGVWSSPITISSAPGATTFPQIAVDPAGNAVAVWLEVSSGLYTVQSSTLPFGGSWSSPTPISVPSTNFSELPQVAVDPAGNAVAVWSRFNSSSKNVMQAATLPFGGVWTSPVDLTSASENATVPQVSVDASGNAVAIWQNSSLSLIQSATLPFGGNWSSPVNLSGTSALFPQIAVDPAGNAVAVWRRSIGPNQFIQAATLPFGGSWSAAVNVSNPGSSGSAQVAVDNVGNAIAIWSQSTGGSSIVRSATLPYGGSWTSPVDISLTGARPQIAIDSTGNAIAVWYSGVIQAAMLPFGGTWSAPIDLSTAGENSISPQIAINPNGYAVVDWTNATLQVIQSTQWTPPPTVTTVQPNFGPAGCSNTVTITGTNFIDVTAVQFDGTNALSFTVVSPTTITATAPPEAAGTVDVTVTTNAGTSLTTVNDNYTYLILTPTVTGVSPNSGSASGGNTVVISGTGFIDITAVQFGGVNALSFTLNSSSSITATAPAGTNCSTVDITVTGCGGISPITSKDKYTYQTSPTVTSVSPNSGSASGGNTVVISGTNFIDTTKVQFGGIDALSFQVNSATSITATAPAGTNCAIVDIRVTGCGSTSPKTSKDKYTYQIPPTVQKLEPNMGPLSGHNKVKITGTNFIGTTSIQFGDVEALDFKVNSEKSITAIAPAGTKLATVDVRVTGCGGTSSTTAHDKYSYKSFAPLPPSNFRARIQEKSCSDVLKMKWKASPSSDVIAYKIYKKRKVIATISARSSLHFEKTVTKCMKLEGYSITALNKQNQESKHVKLKITH